MCNRFRTHYKIISICTSLSSDVIVTLFVVEAQGVYVSGDDQFAVNAQRSTRIDRLALRDSINIEHYHSLRSHPSAACTRFGLL